jgi:hypothetical protein
VIRFFDFFNERKMSVFSVIQCSHFFGYFFALSPFQLVPAARSGAPVIHRISRSTPASSPVYPSTRPSMLYIDHHTAGPTPGQINISIPRLTAGQNGQEHSANGTGPEEICAKGGAASNGIAAGCHIIVRHVPSKRPHCHTANYPACLPRSACALAGTAGGPCGHRRSTRQSGGLN